MENNLTSEQFKKIKKCVSLFTRNDYFTINNWKIEETDDEELTKILINYTSFENDEDGMNIHEDKNLYLYLEILQSNISIMKYRKFRMLKEIISNYINKNDKYKEKIENNKNKIKELEIEFEIVNDIVKKSIKNSIECLEIGIKFDIKILKKLELFDNLNKNKGIKKWECIELDKEDFWKAGHENLNLDIDEDTLNKPSGIFDPLF